MTSRYALPNESPETGARFAGLEDTYDDWSRRQLEQAGVEPGMRCLELGGGGGSIARWLAERVGADGRVVVTDIDPRHLKALADGVIEVRRHDIAADALEEAAFDLIHARIVLMHLREREQVLAKLVRALRPGGRILLEDLDAPTVLIADGPEVGTPALDDLQALFDRVWRALNTAMGAGGFEATWGRFQHAAMRRAGLDDLATAGYTTLCSAGSKGAEFYRASVRLLNEKMLATGLVTAEEIAQWHAAMGEPDRAVMCLPLISTLGTKPR